MVLFKLVKLYQDLFTDRKLKQSYDLQKSNFLLKFDNITRYVVFTYIFQQMHYD